MDNGKLQAPYLRRELDFFLGEYYTDIDFEAKN